MTSIQARSFVVAPTGLDLPPTIAPRTPGTHWYGGPLGPTDHRSSEVYRSDDELIQQHLGALRRWAADEGDVPADEAARRTVESVLARDGGPATPNPAELEALDQTFRMFLTSALPRLQGGGDLVTLVGALLNSPTRMGEERQTVVRLAGATRDVLALIALRTSGER